MPKGMYEREYKIPKNIEQIVSDLNKFGTVVNLLKYYGVTRSAWDAFLVRHNVRITKITTWSFEERDPV